MNNPVESDNIEYVSFSSIDSPPPDLSVVEKNEFKQEAPRLYSGERMFDVEFSVVLKPVEGKPIKVPLFAERLRGTIIEESLELALRDTRNQQIVKAILDNPKDRILESDAANHSEPAQGGLF